MPPNYVHKIVHISALFYQSLSIISASGRKLLKMKNSKRFFFTPSIYQETTSKIQFRFRNFISYP